MTGSATSELLFVPELLLGIDDLEPATRKRLQDYLAAVARQRGLPLHPAVAWNALYFTWDLDAHSYLMMPAKLPTVTLRERADALPVGAMAWVRGGGNDVWAEIVYKEGRHPSVQGAVPAEVSGARTAADADGAVTLTELLVADFEAFGPLGELSSKLARWARNGRWLTEHGHLLVDATYDPGADADDPDLLYYARWLWDHQWDSLEDGWLGHHLGPDHDDEDVWDALLASLLTVDELLSDTPGLSRWATYSFETERYRERLAAQDTPLGADDLRYLVQSLAEPPRGHRVVYGAVSQRLHELARGHDTDLRGTRYVTTVCHANRFLADQAASAGDGVVRVRAEHCHLRVDDVWQWGGIWRGERLAAGEHCPLTSIAPQMALGLGAAAEQPDVHEVAARPAAVEPVEVEPDIPAPAVEEPAATAPDAAEPPPVLPDDPLADLQDSHLNWTVTLRQADLNVGTMPIADRVGPLLRHATADHGNALLLLAHDGGLWRLGAKVGKDGRWLTGLNWPADFFPGIRLLVTVGRGGNVIHATTVVLDNPVQDGDVWYEFAFDPAVVGDLPQDREQPPATLTTALVGVLRRHGRLGDDGTRAATANVLCARIYGLDPPEQIRTAVRAALEEAVERGRLRRVGDEYVWAPMRATRPPAEDQADVDEFRLEPAAREQGERRRHHVTLHLRRLRRSVRAAPDRQELYERLVADHDLHGDLPGKLPAGYTFVIPHERGTREPVWQTALEEINQ